MNKNHEIGQRAAARAIESVKRCAAVAGLAIVLSPLASLPAQALQIVPVTPVTGGDPNGTPIGVTYSQLGTSLTYTFYNNANGDGSGSGCTFSTCVLTGISLPEYHAYDINFTNGLPNGWVYTESASPAYPGAAVTGGTAGGYANLTFNQGTCDTSANCVPIFYDTSLSFTALIPDVSLIDASFGYQLGGFYLENDPPIPNTQALVVPPNGVPEPSVPAILGIGSLAALLAARRRRRS